ncbi:hypothetical protein DPMN_017728 [Dreissena polymorpha]|uniref:AIG1-type G domain-containing protein n=1 Tax=Dreissena polymorpha TaxID=45954 RepID=A0A9D4S7L8_DREPO|nr:hypothetical protein DPMN_017728 [Dreissena polymorpha]
MLEPGFHAVCFVLDPHRIADVKDQFQPIMQYFGDEANDYAFVLMTFTRNEEELEKILPDNINDKHPKVATVLKFCKDKELYIDNKVPPEEREEIIEDMFNYIDSENDQKLKPYFSSRFKHKTEAVEAAEAARISEAAKNDIIQSKVKVAALEQSVKLANEAAKAMKDAEAARAAENRTVIW